VPYLFTSTEGEKGTMSVTATINSYLDNGGLVGELVSVLTTGENWKTPQALPDPWLDETPPPPPPRQEIKPIEEIAFLLKGGPVVIGGAYNIPTCDNDPLLASVSRRGRWQRPLALQRKDFETTFSMKERRVVPVEEVLIKLRAGHWPNKAALARYYGKLHSWTNSFKWFLIRERHLASTGEWDALFPKRPATKKPRQRQATAPRHSGPIAPASLAAPFKLPALDENGEAID
jgi:hypothetical protein